MVENVKKFGAGFVLGEERRVVEVVRSLAHLAQDFGAAAILGGGYFLKVGEGPVHLVAVDMVDFEAFGPRSDEGLPDEMMAETGREIAHRWIGTVHVGLSALRVWTEGRFKFASRGIEKLALVGTVKNLAANGFRWNLLDNWYIHNTAHRRDVNSERRCEITAFC